MRYISTLALTLLILVSCSPEQKEEKASEPKFSIEYEKFELENGLEVVLHEDHSDPIVAVATLMHVGSNREKPGRTGFAHFFEHMSFNDSENVPVGANRKLIPEWGGSRNGGTWNDGTIYYEVVPKDAFEKILWIDSDRFGYMINTVTKDALEREKQVVKNEKRERVDNAPYGFTNEVIIKNLYPEGHPYSWTVIGELEDLQAATLEDVKEFYSQYYGAANATLVIAGDINIEETKELVEKWFGEIKRGPEVEALKPMPVSLDETKSFYFEDNFAKLPELRMVFPSVEQYHQDEVALEILGDLLSDSKKAPLYKTIVEEKKLAPQVYSGQSSKEIAGEFMLVVRANAAVDLDSVKSAIDEGFALFETEGFDDKDLTRIKAQLETRLFQGVETVLNKAFTLVQDNEFIGDPGYIVKKAEKINAVTREDIMRVYEKYIKGQNYIMTSFVPKGQMDLIVDGSQKASVKEEEIVANVENEEVSQGEEAEYEKTPSKYDRSEPDFGEMPLFAMPNIWKTKLKNTGIEVYGIESNEIPLVSFDITIEGGHYLDPIEKSGVSELMSQLMMEGTAKRSASELEEAIGLLGASINISTGNEEMIISGTCLSKNFEETVKLVQEILLEPRWDQKEYERLKQALETNLKGREANPTSLAYTNFTNLVYGNEHILGLPDNGTLETISEISLDDLKAYYSNNLSASLASVHVVGFVDQARVLNAFEGIDQNWSTKSIQLPEYTVPENINAGKLYFIDVPDAKQSVIFLGRLALAGGDADFNNLQFANEILGGGSSGRLFQTLRIEKGYTYGAYSSIREYNEVSPFFAYSSVRANATKESLDIIIDMLENYGPNFSQEDVETTKNKLLKENTRKYESLNAKLGILRDLSKFDKSMKFIEEDQNELISLSLEDYKRIIDQHITDDKMVYLVVGDKATQLQEINKVGLGDAIELDLKGNVVN